MDDISPEEKKAWMRQRVRQLRNQLDEISGGEAVFGSPEENPDLPLEVELQFLEQVVGFETAAMTTWRKKMSETGYDMPAPDTLDDEQVSFELWQVIQRLSELHAYLDRTDHLSDRELYDKLYENLNEPVEDIYMGLGAGCHLELLAPGDEEDDRIWLRYFADEAIRRQWKEEFGVELPLKEEPPYDRDRLLPKQEFPESPELKFARRLAETAWDPETSPMKLSDDVRPADLEDVVSVQLARTLLAVLGAKGRAKATAKRGLLPRAVVREVFESQPFPPERIHSHYELSRSYDEEEYQRIHFVRIACQKSGLIRKHAGAFQLTKKGARLASADRVVDLYLELFRAGFSKVNLAAFDGVDGWDSLQYGLPVVLLRLWEEGKEWVPMEDASAVYQLPEPYYELLDEVEDPTVIAHILWLRLFRWLADFGLVDCAVGDPDGTYRFYPETIRISDFGRRMLDFDRPDFPKPYPKM